jgi:flagellar motor switch protein FliN/FliY
MSESSVSENNLDVVLDMEMEAALHFGSAQMMLRDVMALGPGDVVELDRQAGAAVDLVVGERIVARGEVVVVKGNFALRVTEVVTPQLRLESAQ